MENKENAKVLEQFIGQTLKSIKVNNDKDSIIFELENGANYEMYHVQDCCESVYIEDVAGNLDNLIGSPLTMAEESWDSKGDSVNDESCTWTFYKFATVKGYVTIRWFGESNGYYSESVDIRKI